MDYENNFLLKFSNIIIILDRKPSIMMFIKLLRSILFGISSHFLVHRNYCFFFFFRIKQKNN